MIFVLTLCSTAADLLNIQFSPFERVCSFERRVRKNFCSRTTFVITENLCSNILQVVLNQNSPCSVTAVGGVFSMCCARSMKTWQSSPRPSRQKSLIICEEKQTSAPFLFAVYDLGSVVGANLELFQQIRLLHHQRPEMLRGRRTPLSPFQLSLKLSRR